MSWMNEPSGIAASVKRMEALLEKNRKVLLGQAPLMFNGECYVVEKKPKESRSSKGKPAVISERKMEYLRFLASQLIGLFRERKVLTNPEIGEELDCGQKDAGLAVTLLIKDGEPIQRKKCNTTGRYSYVWEGK
jgi:hypothetical protein